MKSQSIVFRGENQIEIEMKSKRWNRGDIINFYIVCQEKEGSNS